MNEKRNLIPPSNNIYLYIFVYINICNIRVYILYIVYTVYVIILIKNITHILLTKLLLLRKNIIYTST